MRTEAWIITFSHEHFHAYQLAKAPKKGAIEGKVEYPFEDRAHQGFLLKESKVLYRALQTKKP